MARQGILKACEVVYGKGRGGSCLFDKVSRVWLLLLGFLLRSVERFCTARIFSTKYWAAQHNMLSKSIRKCEAVPVKNNLHLYLPYSLTDSISEAICWGTISQKILFQIYVYCPLVHYWNSDCGIWKLRNFTEPMVYMSSKESFMSLGKAQTFCSPKSLFTVFDSKNLTQFLKNFKKKET